VGIKRDYALRRASLPSLLLIKEHPEKKPFRLLALQHHQVSQNISQALIGLQKRNMIEEAKQ
jgi:hypothetical protein